MKLTENEKELFALLRKKKKVSLDELELILGGSRHALIVRIKYLSAKLAQEGWIVQNNSGIGRGAKAVFSVEKKF